MEDDLIGLGLAAAFVGLAALALRQDNLKLRGFTAVLLCSMSIAALTRHRISEMVVSQEELRLTLSQIETQLTKISEAMETLVVSQQITALEPDNSILLDYEPVPHSVRLVIGPLINYPRPAYGFQLDGRRIRIVKPSTLERVTGRLPHGVTVDYMRRVSLGEGDDAR